MTDSTEPYASLDLVPLAGSERPPAPGVQPAESPSRATEGTGVTASATIVVRRREAVPDSALEGAAADRDSYVAAHGADPADVELVTKTLTDLGLVVDETDVASRRVRVHGPVDRLAAVFGTRLDEVTSEAPTPSPVAGSRVVHRHRTGGLSVPRVLDGVVTAVLGLDDRPQARAQFRVAQASATQAAYTPVELGAIYDFPAGTDGAGQTVAIIELGGGFVQADLDTYFSSVGVGHPRVTAVGVDGAANKPGQDPSGADGEVMLDIEVVGGLAPKADIVVYFAPNTDAGFVDAVSQAAHATPTPTSMSISWGQSEDQWTAQARQAFDEALVDAAALGVTVTAAAGDNGSGDGATDGSRHVDFPAASPHVLSCGGTTLTATAGTEGTAIASETVWNNGAGRGATGGGVSDTFALPDYQARAGVPALADGATGRGVPDVAGNADPETGYEVLVDGARSIIGGTSAVAPLWAALVRRLAQSLGSPLGLLQPKLYAASGGFHDITDGDNGAYRAGVGWDACTGLGSPDGAALLVALRR